MSCGNEIVDVGRRRERCLLGLLLLEANHPLPIDRLVDLLWDGEPSATAGATLRSHVSRLRSSLRVFGGAITLARAGTGYVANVDAATVDAWRFRTLVAQARFAGSPAERAEFLRAALAQWQGPVLADCASHAVRARIGEPWEEARLAVVEATIKADLDSGRHGDVIGELTALGAEHPYHERFASLLMLALYRCGRRADALEVFQRLDRRLRSELGIGAGHGATSLHQWILTSDSRLGAGRALPENVALDAPERALGELMHQL